MDATAIVLESPEQLVVRSVKLDAPGAEDIVVDIEWSGISTGTERLLFRGTMPPFPGMGYPLVPGYESVGRISAVPHGSRFSIGQRVFVPGARCFGEIRGLFGGAASRLVVAESRIKPVDETLGEDAILLALAATAFHAFDDPDGRLPDLIVGHGVLGRLLARLTLALGHSAPRVWERNTVRATGASGYEVIDPEQDQRRDYSAIYDVSGDSTILDRLIARLKPQGEIVLAGFYTEPMSFAFAPAFMRESRIRVAAEWKDKDLVAVQDLIRSGALSLEGLITHRSSPEQALDAYRVAFDDPQCLKMVLDWRGAAD
jgi:3-hydroxyethyl bacteriochlorophyllide a dehydrogenase